MISTKKLYVVSITLTIVGQNHKIKKNSKPLAYIQLISLF